MMTFMEVKAHHRSHLMNYVLWLSNLVRKNPWCNCMMMMMTFIWDKYTNTCLNFHRGQRSSEVKCGKPCAMVTKLHQKNTCFKFMMMTFMAVKGHYRSNMVKTKCYGYQNIPWCKFMMMLVLMVVKVHRRSNMVTLVLYLPNLVGRISDDGDNDLYGCQRSSEVKCVKLCSITTIIIWLEEFRRTDAPWDDDL